LAIFIVDKNYILILFPRQHITSFTNNLYRSRHVTNRNDVTDASQKRTSNTNRWRRRSNNYRSKTRQRV